MSSGDREATRYARTIEGSWSEFLQQPVVLSPRDWELICQWHAKRIPLELIREAIDAAAERRDRRGSPPTGLSYIAPAVEEAWTVVRQGRLSPQPPADAEAAGRRGREAWRVCLAAQRAGSALQRLLVELLGRAEAGDPASELDRRLDSELPGAVPAALWDEADAQMRTALAPFRGRMAAETYEATLQRGAIERVRDRLGLVRLATQAAEE